MKKIYRILFFTLIIASLLTNTTFAAEMVIGSTNTYEDALKAITVWYPDQVINISQGSDVQNENMPIIIAWQGGKQLNGTTTFPDFGSSILGLYEFTWVFTPEDTSIDPISGTVKINIVLPPQAETPEEVTVPSLTATSISLNAMTAYDINLNDKVAGCTYLWSSSDTDVVTVNSKNGLLRAISEGTAIVSCDITFPDTSTQTLESQVTVGYDDNAPVLTETTLDLNTGDTFDINLENKIAKSKYRWVSSDRNIVTVNSANGKVTAIAPGTAYVTCTITTPGNQVIVLRADINVMAPAVEAE